MRPIIMLVLAASSAALRFFSPRRLDMSELTPTPLPTVTDIMSSCIGITNETAVRAALLICATKILSTTL